ncbi:MAG TPA: Eco57I restriction-modification methylase domain-containing protein [Streptosporangiaceae bacterium]
MPVQQGVLDLGPDIEDAIGQASLSVPDPDIAGTVRGTSPLGVVYTRAWVVDLILDLCGYRPSADLAARYAVEPAAGAGAFLVPMATRLVQSVLARDGEMARIGAAIRAYELDPGAAARAAARVASALADLGVTEREAGKLADGWITAGDYLREASGSRRADLVVGNPPYIRYDDIAPATLAAYRSRYPTMAGRCDIYVGFLEAGLRQLAPGGTLGFICADRWMRSAYGAELRRLIGSAFAVQAVIEMHNAPAFAEAVSAYPSVVVLRRAPQGRAIVAAAGSSVRSAPGQASLADAVTALADGLDPGVPGLSAASVDRWYQGPGPWPALEPSQLRLLQRLEARFEPLEDPLTDTRIGIGVATGADAVFVADGQPPVEPDRLLPLAMTADTRDGVLRWSGHYLVNPWTRGGQLVDLATYPRLGTYLTRRKRELQDRSIARRFPQDWYRTIDKVRYPLTAQPKLYFPDMKLASNPVLDTGQTYPHHNLYYLTSGTWDLEVLGGLLLSRVAQLFVEAYCVRMRGGTLRFQAQYLRRIRVPRPASLPVQLRERLRDAFRARDAGAATAAAIEAYGIADETATRQSPTQVRFPAPALGFRQFAAAIDAQARAFVNTRV